MIELRNHVIANFGGQAITIVVGILFMPIHVRIKGVESYGAIGFYVSLQALFAILDVGHPASLNREFARLDVPSSGALLAAVFLPVYIQLQLGVQSIRSMHHLLSETSNIR